MQTEGKAESNLAVIIEKAYESEYVKVHALVREFLGEEYRVVRNILNEHRELLDQLADRLMWDPVVDQAEMSELYDSYKVGGKI